MSKRIGAPSLAEDLYVVLLDGRGHVPRGAPMRLLVGASLLSELALLQRVGLGQRELGVGDAPVVVRDAVGVRDDLLLEMLGLIAERPRTAADLCSAMGRRAHRTRVLARLRERGTTRRVLGLSGVRDVVVDERARDALVGRLSEALRDGPPINPRLERILALLAAGGGIGRVPLPGLDHAARTLTWSRVRLDWAAGVVR